MENHQIYAACRGCARRARGPIAVLMMTLAGSPAVAAAQHTSYGDDEIAAGRTAFIEANLLADDGRWEDALAMFERSSRYRPHPLTTYNMAYCEHVMGHYTRARKLFRKALLQDEDGTGLDGREEAIRELLEAIERRLSEVTVTLSPADATLQVDGRPLEAERDPGGAARLVAGTSSPGAGHSTSAAPFVVLLDPGSHVFVASRPGGTDVVVSRAVPAGASIALTIAVPRPEGPRSSDAQRIAGYAIAGVGAVAVSIGTYFGIKAITTSAEAEKYCVDTRCTAPGLELSRDSGRAATVANVALGAGVLALGLGVGLTLSSDTPPRPAGAKSGAIMSPRVVATARQDGAFLGVHGAW